MITPGPVVSTTGLIGYLVAGFWGALVAALATFVPCYLVTVVPAPYFKRHGKHPAIIAFVDGVTAAAIGCLGATPPHSDSTQGDILEKLIASSWLRRFGWIGLSCCNVPAGAAGFAASAAGGAPDGWFKAVAGREDRAGELVWRWKDGDNYDVAGANALDAGLLREAGDYFATSMWVTTNLPLARSATNRTLSPTLIDFSSWVSLTPNCMVMASMPRFTMGPCLIKIALGNTFSTSPRLIGIAADRAGLAFDMPGTADTLACLAGGVWAWTAAAAIANNAKRGLDFMGSPFRGERGDPGVAARASCDVASGTRRRESRAWTAAAR